MKWAAAVIGIQFLATSLAAGLAGAALGANAALAALSGGLIMLVATLFVAVVALRPSGDASVHRALKQFYIGALGKYIIVVMGLLVAFSQAAALREEANALVLFATLFFVQSAYWLAPQLMQRTACQRRKRQREF